MQTSDDNNDDLLISSLHEIEIYALFLLSGAENTPIPTKTAYQKELFFIANTDEKLRDATKFKPYRFGPYSVSAESAMKHLIEYGLVQDINCDSATSSATSYYITEKGKRIVENLKPKHPEIDNELIDEIKIFLNNLNYAELILFTYVLNPSYATESEIRDKILPNRVLIARDMYLHGKVDLEMASHLSGLSMEKFLDEIRRKE